MTELRERVARAMADSTMYDGDMLRNWIDCMAAAAAEDVLRPAADAAIAAVMQDLPIIGLWEDAASFRIRQDAWLAQYRKEQASE